MKYAIIEINGPKAESFLQGQVTCDVQSAQTDFILGARCNLQGRVVASFYLHGNHDRFELHCPADVVDILIKDLKRYAAFSKTNLVLKEEIDKKDDAALINSGIALIGLATSGLFLPQELNYDQLGAVSFNKGCYLGQEIIARIHYRGKVKQHLHLIESSETINFMPSNKLYEINSEKLLLTFVSVYEKKALVVMTEKSENEITGQDEMKNSFTFQVNR